MATNPNPQPDPAANKQTDPAPAAKSAASKNEITVDLHNPTFSRRVIHSGVEGSNHQITINPGETKHSVTIAKWIADELRERTKGRGNENKDLHVHPEGEGPATVTS